MVHPVVAASAASRISGAAQRLEESPASASRVHASADGVQASSDAVQTPAASATQAPVARSARGPFGGVTRGILRLGRRLALFVGMLTRRFFPRRVARSKSAPRGPLARALDQTSSWVSSRAPSVGPLVGRMRGRVSVLAPLQRPTRGSQRLPARTPKVRLRELADTFTMMLRAEPPPAAVTTAQASAAAHGAASVAAHGAASTAAHGAASTAAHGAASVANWSQGHEVAAQASTGPLRASCVLDAESIAPEDAELDALLFGHSQPGLEPENGTLVGLDSQPEGRDLDLDSRPDLDSDPGVGSDPDAGPCLDSDPCLVTRPELHSAPGRELAPGRDARPDLDSAPGLVAQPGRHAEESLPSGVLETLARLARDTSPGTLEAPDTLPG